MRRPASIGAIWSMREGIVATWQADRTAVGTYAVGKAGRLGNAQQISGILSAALRNLHFPPSHPISFPLLLVI